MPRKRFTWKPTAAALEADPSLAFVFGSGQKQDAAGADTPAGGKAPGSHEKQPLAGLHARKSGKTYLSIPSGI